MHASVATLAIEGVSTREVTVEVDVRPGLETFTLVGLPDRAIRESRERIRAALLNSGLEFPRRRLTVNLAPAHVHKAGASFDLGIAVALLGASGQIQPEELRRYAVCGELSLTGYLRPVRGAIAVALGARDGGCERLVVPPANAGEAALVDGVEILAVPNLARLADLFHGRWLPEPPPRPPPASCAGPGLDLADVRGQDDAKRALEIAAAGGHNLLMVGPPGSGKTMLARRLPSIMPPPTFEEALEITQVQSVAGVGDGRLATQRPFRAPHHTISPSGLAGGGPFPRPGEVTLAHRGVLFLDEIAEFSRPALDALRQPLEDRRVEVMRGQRTIAFPASVMLVAACNPCPCARPADQCTCGELELQRYARRLSGPLLDRIDLVCEIDPVPTVELVGARSPGTTSQAARERVVHARARQRERLRGTSALCNGEMDARLTRRAVPLERPLARRLLGVDDAALLSGRGQDRVLRVARTIADLADRRHVRPEHLEEALAYRLPSAVRAAA